jgi:hypothetical protein
VISSYAEIITDSKVQITMVSSFDFDSFNLYFLHFKFRYSF